MCRDYGAHGTGSVREVDPHHHAPRARAADLGESGISEDLTAADVQLTPGDLLAGLRDHWVCLQCAGAALPGEVDLRTPAPGQPVTITNQMINTLNSPVEAAYKELDQAGQAADAVPARIRLGDLAPDMIRLEAEVKQITHAIRMAAYNAETTLARALNGRYARAGDIIPSDGQLLVRLDPLTAPRRTQALAALCSQLTQARARYPGTDLLLRYEIKPHPDTA